MTSDARLVRHLRVSAPDEAAVRALLPRLEDALRCASLPDGGARVLLVRRLALGRVAAGISAGALAQRVEQRLAESDVTWIDGGTAMAERAEHVCFASALDARLQLAARLLRGQPCEAWYWRLAVPEWRRGEPLALQLRAITLTVAGWPEAAVALPVWAAGVVRAWGAGLLGQAFDEAQGAALLRHVGRPSVPAHALAAASPSRASWLDTLLGGGGTAVTASRSSATAPPARAAAPGIEPDPVPTGPGIRPGVDLVRDRQPRPGVETSADHADAAGPANEAAIRIGHRQPAAAQQDTGDDAGAATLASDGASKGQAAAAHLPSPHAPKASPADAGSSARPGPAPQPVIQAASGQAADDSVAPPHRTAAPGWPAATLARSRCAGLLFLLPVLARLGIVDACEAAGLDCATFARAVLRSVLQRLRVPPDDPAWALAENPSGRVTPALPPDALRLAHAWRHDTQRWLRRAGGGGGLGLARLVLRPGQMALTATHADIHFRLADADLRVRRLGLDIDPGWLPWFGRVVAFHYSSGDAPLGREPPP
ncbi:conserved hypothetical protein [Leptothrix cholodnii SP-6]|uniref:Uncharacterized protein n=1 Tax=Leptothrix cholodnii (strain ATCC 51168 / LMG 8142 / SP-6) TaxID=395495 RepID=B1Y032_LEPCP|nr:hypothetical protein [Leptothrix cholodnii]ACB35313.1 conserved hypothetical protein [Leptothrix cholodnii SP-6]